MTRHLRLGLALASAAVVVGPALGRTPSLEDRIRDAFPAIGQGLSSSEAFEPASLEAEGVRVEGLRPKNEPTARPRPPHALSHFFPSVYSDPFEVRGGGVAVRFRPLGALEAPARIEAGKVVYNGAYADTDVLYAGGEGRFEEFMLLLSEAAPRRFAYALSTVPGTAAVEVQDGTVRFDGESGPALLIERPWVIDARGRRSDAAASWALGPGIDGEPRLLTLELDTTGLAFPLLLDPTWTSPRTLTVRRSGHSATLLSDGRILLAGGNAGLGPATSAEIYDPATGLWTATGPMNVSRTTHTATLLGNGKVLVAGGFNSVVLASAELYDPATGTWSLTGSLNGPRDVHTAVRLGDGRVLVVGGSPTVGTTNLRSCELYDPVTETWSTAPTMDMALGRRAHTTTLLTDGKVLVAGGWNAVSTHFSSAERFDPATLTWAPVASMNNVRGFHTATLLPDGRVVVAGGNGGFGNTSELFDPAGSGSWSLTAGNLTTFRHGPQAALLPDGRVFLSGGHNGSIYLASTELFDPASGTWSASVPMASARQSHTSTLLPDGRVLVAGGNNVAGTLQTSETFDPAVLPPTGTWTGVANLLGFANGHTATLLPDGTVLVVESVAPGAETFDAAAGTWTATGAMTNPRRWHSATLLVNGKVLVAGGNRGGPVLAGAELYDPVTRTWSPTGSLTTPRELHTATLLPCGRVLVAGGEQSSGVNLRSAEIYDPLTGLFTPTADLLTERREHTATLLKDGRVLVTGGVGGGSWLAGTELYDSLSGTWSATGALNRGRRYHTATLLPNGKVLVAAGSDPSNIITAELYDPGSGSWTFTGSLIEARDRHAASLLPNGKVLLHGGFTGAFGFKSVELYDPAAGTWTAATSLTTSRESHTSTLLPNGKVLAVAGSGSTTSAEIYDAGLGALDSWRPVLSAMTDPLVEGSPAAAGGSRFQGISEASAGRQGSATNYPLLQLRRIENEDARWLRVSQWSDAAFLSLPTVGLQPGHALATVFANGIPSAARVIRVECPAPAIIGSPASSSLCEGGSAVFSVASTGSCPGYRWRKDGTPLSEGGRHLGTRTATLTVSPADPADTGVYDVLVSSACSTTAVTSAPATLTVTPNLSSVSISVTGSTFVCPSCTGGSASVSDGGGGPLSHQWGYRTASGGPITDIPGETGGSYVIDATDFGGSPGVYYLVETTTPTCGAPRVSNEVAITVFTVAPGNEVPFFTATSKDGENKVEWLNPGPPYVATLIRYAKAPTGTSACTPPADPGDGTELTVRSAGGPGTRDSFIHAALENQTGYCYAAFVHKGGGAVSDGVPIKGRPFDTPAGVKWAFSTGLTALTPPAVGAVVHAVSNDRNLHAMARGAGGGDWPPSWTPFAMNGPAQHRPVSVPVTIGSASRVVFLASQDGRAYAVDAATGLSLWPVPPTLGSILQGGPSAWLRAFGAPVDRILVGTHDSGSNTFYALRPDGSEAWRLGPPEEIGMINGRAFVDYDGGRVFFASLKVGSGDTLWCLDLATGNKLWSKDLGSISGSPTLREGRLYVGTDNGDVHVRDADSGDPVPGLPPFPTTDGPVRGFITADGLGENLYFSTNTTVWSLSIVGSVWTLNWKDTGITQPSVVLFTPGEVHLYVGSTAGRLYELDVTTGTPVTPPDKNLIVLGDGGSKIGAPTLDVANDLIYVGSEEGVFYAVEQPLP